jgi:hypothetical protein
VGGERCRRVLDPAPKAIATIRLLADTLEERSIVVTSSASRLGPRSRPRRRDSEELGEITQAKRWADDTAADRPRPKLPI